MGRLGEVGAVDVEDKALDVEEAAEERSAILAKTGIREFLQKQHPSTSPSVGLKQGPTPRDRVLKCSLRPVKHPSTSPSDGLK